jgi:GNAT superfamily N-acetyltransferase
MPAKYGTNTTFDANNPDIRYDGGGEIESLISKGILELNFYETTSEHAKEYGIEAKKPLYVQNLCVSENERLKGIGKKVLNYLEEYARKNGNDVIFGHVSAKASFTKDSRQSFFCDVDMIKNWLHNNGYAINGDNNIFHKVVKLADGTNTTQRSKCKIQRKIIKRWL